MGERRGGNIAGHTELDEVVGRRDMHADSFTWGGVVGPPEGEGEFGRHIVSPHGEEKCLETNGLPAGMGNSA